MDNQALKKIQEFIQAYQRQALAAQDATSAALAAMPEDHADATIEQTLRLHNWIARLSEANDGVCGSMLASVDVQYQELNLQVNTRQAEALERIAAQLELVLGAEVVDEREWN